MKRPPRFAIACDAVDGGVALVQGAELRHMRDVMRLRTGARISLIDERGAEYDGIIRRFETERAVVEIARSHAPQPSPRGIILAAAIIKGPRMDFMVEKAAEIGAAELWPLLCARGVARAPGDERLARWRRLASAAAKQSLAACPMEIRQPRAFADLIRNPPPDTLGIVCAIGAEPLGGLIARMRPRRILIACGPEGDFDREENDMGARAGLIRAGLGRNRLRSETAAIAALSIATAAMDELDGGD